MKNKLAYWCYRYLKWYCKSFAIGDRCEECIFDSKRIKCGCIANIPDEWETPRY